MNRVAELSGATPLAWISLAFPGGAAWDPTGLEGLAHHTGELARRGAGTRSRAELDAALDQMGASLDAGTNRDSLGLNGTCLSRHLPDVFAAALDVLCSPKMADDEHEKLVRETAGELDEVRDDDQSLAMRFFSLHVAPGHAYARAMLGTDGSLPRLSVELARDHHRRSVTRAGAIFGVAGDVEPALADELAARLEATLPDRPALAPADLSVPEIPGGRRLIVVDKPQRTQSQILFGHVGPRFGSDESVDLLPVETAFGGMFTSRLMQAIRVERGWSYGASCKLQRSRGPHWFTIQLAPSAEVTPDALALALSMYEELCASGIRDDELEFAKGFLRGNHAFSRATPRQRLGDSMREVLCDLPRGFHERLPERIAEVTPTRARSAIDRCLSSRDLCVVVVATADAMLPRLERFGFDSVQVVAHDSY